MGNMLQSPGVPEVELIDRNVVIRYGDGSQLVWSIEEDVDPLDVLNKIKDGLRAIMFLQRSIDSIIDACFVILAEIGFSEELRAEFLNETFRGIIPRGLSTETKNSSEKASIFYLR